MRPKREKLEVEEMRMLRWTYDSSMLDMILNEVFQEEAGVVIILAVGVRSALLTVKDVG